MSSVELLKAFKNFDMSKFQYKTVIMRNVCDTLAEYALRMDECQVDIKKVKEQHNNYKQALSSLGLRVLLMETDEKLPDCVFVEDVVVVVGNKAIITNPGHPTRRGETIEMRKTLEKISGLEIAEMKELDANATLDGGDVMFTGSELFIGVSSRTNKQGVEVMRKYFDDVTVHAIEVSGQLHLKSCMTMSSPNTIFASECNEATQKITQEVKSKATSKYNFVHVKGDMKKANVIYLEDKEGKSVLIHPKLENEILEQLKADTKIMVDTSELGKVDGCLTCCSVFLTI